MKPNTRIVDRDCPTETVTLHTITVIGVDYLDQLIAAMDDVAHTPLQVLTSSRLLAGWVRDSVGPATTGHCPFSGEVALLSHNSEQTWVCPTCGEEAIEEASDV